MTARNPSGDGLFSRCKSLAAFDGDTPGVKCV